MKIGLRGGHSPNCIGAVGYLNEYNECQKIYKRTAEILRAAGHTVIDCNSNGRSASEELGEGTRKANSNNVDFFLSIHMNAGGGSGCEAWAYSAWSKKAVEIGSRICRNISSQLALPNRGVKYSTGYHDLRNTSSQAVIIETLFCDSKTDFEKFDVEKISRSIANGIDPSIPLVVESPKIPVYHVDYLMVYNDGASVDKEIADVMSMILISKGFSTKVLSADEYATNKLGDYWGKTIVLIGGSLKDRFKFDKLIAGKDRYETALMMHEYLKTI